MDIVHEYSERQRSQYDRIRDCTYQQQITTRTTGSFRKRTTTETYEIPIVNGTPLRRLFERNGKPVSQRESQKRQEEFERVAARFRTARIIENAYEGFQLDGEEDVNGRRAWVPFAVHTHQGFHIEQEITYSGHRKFQADSRVLETPVDAGGAPQRRQP